MQDIRIERWAHTLVHYCLHVKSGETVAIHATPLASPLVAAVYRELLQVGAYPIPMIELENLEEILLREGNDVQLTTPSPLISTLAKHIDARLTIGSQNNTKALSGIDPARAAKRRRAYHEVRNTFRMREQVDNFRWCYTLYPTSGYAKMHICPCTSSKSSYSTFASSTIPILLLAGKPCPGSSNVWWIGS